MIAMDERMKMAQWIVNAEARRDTKGRIKLYRLPEADGGGTVEYAGINDRYHPQTLVRIRQLLGRGDHTGAERMAVLHIAQYTDIVQKWTGMAALQAFLRDCAFNRGPKGALRILQLALGLADDGRFGPITKNALKAAENHPELLLDSLRVAREDYERRVAPPVGKRARFWNGLSRRWNAAHVFALSFLNQQEQE